VSTIRSVAGANSKPAGHLAAAQLAAQAAERQWPWAEARRAVSEIGAGRTKWAELVRHLRLVVEDAPQVDRATLTAADRKVVRRALPRYAAWSDSLQDSLQTAWPLNGPKRRPNRRNARPGGASGDADSGLYVTRAAVSRLCLCLPDGQSQRDYVQEHQHQN
jgi:hypothetical protein